MSVQPLVTFKAGICEGPGESGEKTIKCLPEPGFVYLYTNPEDELTHFCWTPRTNTTNEPSMDLIMFPGDGSFQPYIDLKDDSAEDLVSPTNGRIFKLKFSSSSSRHFFWLQSKPSHPSGKHNHFSERDLKLGQIVDNILQGEDVDVQGEIQELGSGPGRPDEDEDMGDAPDNELRRESTGGAGADATGGDFREEGAEAREGGADGGRAAPSALPTDASAAVQNFLQSLGGGATNTQEGGSGGGGGGTFTTLPDLVTPEACIATLKYASTDYLDSLLSFLPPQLVILAQEADDFSLHDEDSVTAEAALEALTIEQKKDILTRVFRSPQLYQSLGSLTMALRDGGLPMVAESLKIKVQNGGMIRGGHVPLGEGQAIEAFLDGVKRTVQEEKKKDDPGSEERMDTT